MSARLRQNRHRAEIRGNSRGCRVEIKQRGNDRQRQNRAARQAPAQFVPDREQRDFLPNPLALAKTTKKVIGKDGEQRAKHRFKHGSRAFRSGISDRCVIRFICKFDGIRGAGCWRQSPYGLSNRP